MSPTETCLVFTLTCIEQQYFDGVYALNENSWKKQYAELTTGFVFSTTVFDNEIQWIFESDFGALISEEFDNGFDTIERWTYLSENFAEAFDDQCTLQCTGTKVPTNEPSSAPVTTEPTHLPSVNPTSTPTGTPSIQPSSIPTSTKPTFSPSNVPSEVPTTAQPTFMPSSRPSVEPTEEPSFAPTSSEPTFAPSLVPTVSPTAVCVVFSLTCGTVFDGVYELDSSAFKMQYVEVVRGDTFYTTSITNQFRWVFESSTGILVSESYSPDFTSLTSWIIGATDETFECQVTCSDSALPTFEPSTSPTTSIPSQVPSSSPTTSRPTELPSNQPSYAPTSLPSVSPSMAPTETCMSFTASCDVQNDKFNGVYTLNEDSWKIQYESVDSDRIFSATYLQLDGEMTMAWAFEGNSKVLVSDSYDADFTKIEEWTFYVDFTPIETIVCSLACSATVIPTTAPTYPVTDEPSVAPSSVPSAQPSVAPSLSPSTEPTVNPTEFPTISPKWDLHIENHVDGKFSDEWRSGDSEAWIDAVAFVFGVSTNDVTVVGLEDIEVEERRVLTVPELNVTAVVTFWEESNFDTNYDRMVDSESQDITNAFLSTKFSLDLTLQTLESVFIGLTGSFNGVYIQPTAFPTVQPTVAPTNFPTNEPSPRPTKAPVIPPPKGGDTFAEGDDDDSDDNGSTVTIVVEGDPDDVEGDDIVDVVTDITGEDTTIVSVTDNGDGTVSVVLDVDCESSNDCADDVNEDSVSIGLADGGHQMNVLSTDTQPKNNVNGAANVQVKTESSTQWMLIAIMAATLLLIYLVYTNRKYLFCKRSGKVIDMDDVIIAKANGDVLFPVGEILINGSEVFSQKRFLSMSSMSAFTDCTELTAEDEGDNETRAVSENAYDGDNETGAPMELTTDDEGDETTENPPKTSTTDGDESVSMHGRSTTLNDFPRETSYYGEFDTNVSKPWENNTAGAVVHHQSFESALGENYASDDTASSAVPTPKNANLTHFFVKREAGIARRGTEKIQTPVFMEGNATLEYESATASETETYYTNVLRSPVSGLSSPSAIEEYVVSNAPVSRNKRGPMSSAHSITPEPHQYDDFLEQTWKNSQYNAAPKKRMLKTHSSRSIGSVYE